MRVMKVRFASNTSAAGAAPILCGFAGALLVALAAFGAPSVARAACAPSPQTISGPVSGPIVSNGGAITVTSTGSVAGKPDGVDAASCSVTTLTDGGKINGGAGAASTAGGVGVSNGQRITSLINPGSITGGAGGRFGAGGAGVSSTGAIGTLSNGGTIGGGRGGSGRFGTCCIVPPGTGGPGMLNAGTVTTLINSGSISGGVGGIYDPPSVGQGLGGAALSNSGKIGALTNSGKISGGAGEGAGVSNLGTISTLTNRGAIAGGGGNNGVGGVGVSNSGKITTLTSSGSISGGSSSGASHSLGGTGIANGGTITSLTNSGTMSGGGGWASGAGVSNSGTITSLTNSGTIRGGKGTAHSAAAILSSGASASIGPITNSGKIIGNVEIDNQASVTIKGGSGTTFGSFTGGAIATGAGDLTFTGGNTDLADNIVVNGVAGKVTNGGVLRLAAPETITGNFAQTASGAFNSLIAGDAAGTYGSLTVTKLATLDGRLSLNLTGGFTLTAGDSFGLFKSAGLSFTSPTHDFRTLTFDGVGCLNEGSGVWGCSNLGALLFKETISASAFNLNVVKGSDPVPEPATWVMLAMGFVGLGFAGYRASRKSVALAA
jgi:PEP-CTERM motif